MYVFGEELQGGLKHRGEKKKMAKTYCTWPYQLQACISRSRIISESKLPPNAGVSHANALVQLMVERPVSISGLQLQGGE